jgi:hypothetical protein
MNAVYRSLEEIKAIADAVVDEEHDCAEIIGVTAGAGQGGYAEIVVVWRDASSPARVMTIGVPRDLTEARLREHISKALRRQRRVV